MDAETIRTLLGTGQQWEKRSDGLWLEDPALDVQNMARLMVEAGARLATITARPTRSAAHRLFYHWDMEGRILTFSTLTREEAVASISSICPAADWIEREIHDCFAVNFTGRDGLSPLLLRPDDPPGMFHWGRKKGDER